MNRAEAERFLKGYSGRSLCVEYEIDTAGEPVFPHRPEPSSGNLFDMAWSAVARTTVAASFLIAACKGETTDASVIQDVAVHVEPDATTKAQTTPDVTTTKAAPPSSPVCGTQTGDTTQKTNPVKKPQPRRLRGKVAPKRVLRGEITAPLRKKLSGENSELTRKKLRDEIAGSPRRKLRGMVASPPHKKPTDKKPTDKK